MQLIYRSYTEWIWTSTNSDKAVKIHDLVYVCMCNER